MPLRKIFKNFYSVVGDRGGSIDDNERVFGNILAGSLFAL